MWPRDRRRARAVEGRPSPAPEAAMVPFAGLLAALQGIPDPRRRQGQRYSLAPLLLFSAFAGEAALILAHQEIAEGDEVAAAQALIEQLGLRGVLFTADALHCQKNVRRRGGGRQRPASAREGQ